MNNLQFTIHKSLLISLFIVYCLLFIGASVAQAQTPTPTQTEYKLLAPLPGISTREDMSECVKDGKPCATASTFIPGLFKLIIAIAGGLAVVKIIFGGIQYMSTDAFTGKSEAKDTIQNAIWGLLLAIGAWLILYTVNPNLVEFNLNIERQEIKTTPPPGETPPPVPSACNDCAVVGVPHKPAPRGCAAPGPCRINRVVNGKLIELDKVTDFLVTESYPPTRTHRNPCHNNGTCVDATIASATEARIKDFIEKATGVGLNAQFETTTEKRAQDIRRATGLSTSKVFYVPGITGEHFSIYNQ